MTSIKHRWIHSALLVAIGAGCIWNAGRMHPGILKNRTELNQAEPMENLPPLVAFVTVALGGFRGVMADVLWVRAQRLQTQGKYIELVQLANWITTLQPRMDTVWAYQGWNMSYNVSVMYPGWDDRWRWVSHGLHLLRDKGLHYNPGSPKIYRELAWTFHHKMGAKMDAAHWHYKNVWAYEMTQVMGGARPNYERFEAVNVTKEVFEALPGTRDLIDRLRKRDVDPYTPTLLSGEGIAKDILDMVAADPAGRGLIDFIRVRRLHDYYHMDTKFMRQLEADLGPLDWRLPQIHAVYWAHRGMPYAKGFDRVALQRLIFQPMASAFNQGVIVMDPVSRTPITTSNPALLDQTLKAFDNALTLHPDETTFHIAYINFLKRAVIELYSYQMTDRANELMQLLRISYPDRYGEEDNEKMLFDFLIRAKNPVPVQVVDQAMGEFIQTAKLWDRIPDANRAAGYRELTQLVRRQASANGIDLPDDDAIIERLTQTYARALKKQQEEEARRAKEPPTPNHNSGHQQGHGHSH